VERVVEVKVPVTVEKIVEKIVYIDKDSKPKERERKNSTEDQGDGLSGLFAALLSSKLDVTEG
jgi:hypothetical protein